MSHYFFIATRDPVNSADSGHLFRQAADLARRGAGVSIYLVQNGVIGVRPLPQNGVRAAYESGVAILADEFSMRERGIAPGEVQEFIESLTMDQLIGRAIGEEDARLIWH